MIPYAPDQQPVPGNLDPWAGPVDPCAAARELQAFKRRQNTRAAQRENAADACGCWANDCDECGPRRADGHRPSKGAVRAAALRSDALLQQAHERAYAAAQRAVS